MFLRVTGLNVRPWFEEHGRTLTDVRSFRIQRDLVVKEIDELTPIEKQFRDAGSHDDADELHQEINRAICLQLRIEQRIGELLETSS